MHIGASQQCPRAHVPAIDAQRIEGQREPSEERLGNGARERAGGGGRVEPGRPRDLEGATSDRFAEGQRGIGVDQELPVDEPHPGRPQAVQGARDPAGL